MPHWDEQETALLIEAYLKVEQGEISRKEAVAGISKLLRDRAISAGYEIDSAFRNEDGIAAQFSKLQRLMQRRPNAELNNMKVFVDMVALYHNEPDRFQTILSGAKESSLKKKEDIFFQWLVADSSGENLSSLQEAYNDAELFAKKKGMVKSSLDEVSSFDKVEQISQILEKDRLFRLFHGRQTQNIVYILDQCRQFITEKEESAQAFVENKDLTAGTENGDVENPAEENETSKYEEIKIYLLVPDENESSEKNSIDKIKEESGKEKTGHGQTSESILIDENGNQVIDSIKNEKIVSHVEENKPEIFENEKTETASDIHFSADNNVGNKLISNSGLTFGHNSFYKRLYKNDFSRDSAFIRYKRMLVYAHVQICRALYEENRAVGNRFATDAVDYLNLAYDILGNEINYNFSNPVRKKHVRAWREGKEYLQLKAENPEYDRDAVEKSWTIIQRYVEQDVSDILNGRVRLIAREDDIVPLKKSKNESNTSDSKTDESEQRSVQWPHDNAQSARISTSNDFADKEFANGTIIPSQEIKPAKSKTHDIDNAANYEEATQNGRVEFMDWLKNHGVSPNSARTAAWALTKVSDLAKKQGYSAQSLYSISDRDILESIRDKILTDPEYEKLRRQNTVVNFAFNRYLEFRGVDGFVVSRSVSQTQKETQARTVPHKLSNIHPGQTEFEQWLLEQNCPTGTIKSCIRSLDDIEKFLLENRKECRSIYTIRGVSRLNRIRNDLIHSESYEKTCQSKNVLLDIHALNKYISFRKKDSAGAIDEETAERFSDVLRRCFENGFRPNSLIDRNRFKQYYSDFYGSAPSQSDEDIVLILKQIGVLQDERIYVREGSRHSDLLDDIHEDIAATFMHGASCIYYSELYARYQNALAEQLQVFSQEVMKNMLVSTSYGEYLTSKHYFHTRNQSPDADIDIRRLMSQSTIPLNYEEIHEQLWYIPMDTIKHCLVTTTELVNVAQETYFNARNLPLSAEELNSIANMIHGQLGQKSFITDQELRSLIKEHCPSAYINTESFTTWGMRNCLAVLLQDRFAFNGPIISEYGNAINTEMAYKEFCQSHESMTLDELKAFATDVNNGYIYWDSVMDVMIRTSQNDFVRKGKIQLDVQAIDHVLGEMFDGDYLALKKCQLFLHYPPISVQWNEFVLESYVAGYSQDFTLLHSGFTASECCGAVVRKNSTIKDFQDVITDVLAHSDKWKTKADALSLLVDEGYLQRKHYTKIDMILSEAKLLREKYQSEE